MNTKKLLIASALATSLTIGAGAALAQDDTAPDAPPTAGQGFRGPRNFQGHGMNKPGGPQGQFGPGGQFGPQGRGVGPQGRFGAGPTHELLEEYTGLEGDALREAHQDGQTLAELIEANGQSVDAFIEAAVAAASDRIDVMVENGRITAERAEELKATLAENITARVNGEFEPMQMGPRFDPNA